MSRSIFLFLASFILMPFMLQAQSAGDAERAVRNNTFGVTVYGLAPVLVYERVQPFSSNFGAIGAIGVFYYGKDYLGYTLGASLYVGPEKHRAEIGGAYLNDELSIAYGAYRYTATNGLFAKSGLGYTFFGNEEGESGVVPMLALGYAF